MPQSSDVSDRSSGNASGLLGHLALVLFSACLCVTAGSSAVFAQFRARERIVEPVDSARLAVTRGNLHPSARPEFDRGQVDPAMRLRRVTMLFKQTPEQQAELQALLRDLQDSSSPNYHRWLTPEAFADRFGLSQLDVDKIVGWLQLQGLTIEQVSRSRTWVAFSGAAQQVQAALRTGLRRYAVRGEMHFAMSREPSVPSAFADVVLGFRGLHDFRLKPRGIRKISPRFTSEVPPNNHYLAPDDFATIYNLKLLYDGGYDGSGQTIAVVGQSAIDVSDVQTFRSLSGLPDNPPQVILVPQSVTEDVDPGMVEGDIDEAYLDVEWAGAVARNATILYVYSQDVLDAFFYVIDQNLAPVLSISYGLCEPDFGQLFADAFAAEAQRANLQGITIVGPSGDAGAADCDHGGTISEQGLSVSLPASLPYVTAVGGTRFNEGSNPDSYWNPISDANGASATMYIPETTWNDTDASGLAASGGGSSIYFPKPSWQTGTGVPNDGARDVPDVSFAASADHDGYLVCSQDYDSTTDTFSPSCENGFRRVDPDPLIDGSLTVFGGTSAGAPVFAGIVALINQYADTPEGQGNVNPTLYALASASPGIFNPITSGNNRVPFRPADTSACSTSTVLIGYDATAGYDRATGLGSVDAFSLVTNWPPPSADGPAIAPADFQLALSPSQLTVNRGACGSAQLALTPIDGFEGTPTFTCDVSSALAGVTCSVTPTSTLNRYSLAIEVPAPSGALLGPGAPNGFYFWSIAALIGACGISFWVLPNWKSNIRVRLCEPGVCPTFKPRLVLLCLVLLALSCSGGSSRNTGVVENFASGTITVTGTIGGVSRTTQIAVSTR